MVDLTGRGALVPVPTDEGGGGLPLVFIRGITRFPRGGDFELSELVLLVRLVDSSWVPAVGTVIPPRAPKAASTTPVPVPFDVEAT